MLSFVYFFYISFQLTGCEEEGQTQTGAASKIARKNKIDLKSERERERERERKNGLSAGNSVRKIVCDKVRAVILLRERKSEIEKTKKPGKKGLFFNKEM